MLWHHHQICAPLAGHLTRRMTSCSSSFDNLAQTTCYRGIRLCRGTLNAQGVVPGTSRMALGASQMVYFFFESTRALIETLVHWCNWSIDGVQKLDDLEALNCCKTQKRSRQTLRDVQPLASCLCTMFQNFVEGSLDG